MTGCFLLQTVLPSVVEPNPSLTNKGHLYSQYDTLLYSQAMGTSWISQAPTFWLRAIV